MRKGSTGGQKQSGGEWLIMMLKKRMKKTLIMAEEEGRSSGQERAPFVEVLKSAFLSLFLLKTLGAQVSITCSSLMAMFDPKLDAGYKTGHLIACRQRYLSWLLC